MQRHVTMVVAKLLLICLLFGSLLDSTLAWNRNNAFFPFPYQTKQLGGQHLVHAGKSLKRASNCFQNLADNYYAYPRILREAGCSLKDAGDAWSQDHWEAVTYAMDDCSSSFVMLSQLQKSPKLQTAYKGAAGEMKAIAGMKNATEATENLIALSNYFRMVAKVEKMESYRQYIDRATFQKYLKEASQSVQTLGKEQR